MSFSCKKTKTEYYSNGFKKYEVDLVGGKKNGFENRWYESGRLQTQFEYKNDTLSGKAKRWFYNGNLQSEDTYQRNKLNGISVIWNEKGYKIIEKTYINDTLNGSYKEWHPNGNIKVEGFNKKGLYHAEWIYYDILGDIVGKGSFDEGRGVLKGFNQKGQIIREVSYQNNMKNGEEKHYDSSGNLEKIVIYKDDKIIDSRK